MHEYLLVGASQAQSKNSVDIAHQRGTCGDEREKIYNLCESLTGARFTTSYTRIGGLSRDLPPGWAEQCRQFCDEGP